MHTPRRQFIVVSSALAAAALASRLFAQTTDAAPPGVRKAPPKPPALPADKVREAVGQAHRSLDAVRALIEENPLLANACWDWGGGDFETPLQAAAHTGQREIAEFLLARQARVDVYAAAMLGQLEFVKAALGPNVVMGAAVPGPHGFTLLHCAKQGGAKAKAVYDFLVAQGVPEVFQQPLPFVWPAGTKPA
jgi:hypothetical protein